ncbi:MAG: hypothetical protein MJ097_04530 [Dorea sp.]|nr:hypothetical protein [Dorea sp.]
MKEIITNYKSIIAEIGESIEDGVITEKDQIQILRADQPVFQAYRPVVDWYYDAFTMKEELELPLEEMYMKEEFSAKEWAEMKKDQAEYKKQYEEDLPKLEAMGVKEVLTEMKQMMKLFK